MKKLLLTLSAMLLSVAAFAQEETVFNAPYYSDFSTDEAWNMHRFIKRSGQAQWLKSTDNTGLPVAVCNNRFIDPTLPYEQRIADDNKCTEQADAWLLTPPINFYAGVEYKISVIAASNYGQSTGSTLTAFAGDKDANVDDYEQIYCMRNIPDYTKGGTREYEYTLYEMYYIPTRTYVGRFGINCTNIVGNTVYLSGYAVETTNSSNAAPAAPTDFSVTPGEKGALNATIKFTAPSTDIKGNDLTSLSVIRVVRDDYDAVEDIENAEPGKEYTIVDNEAMQGMHKYSVIAYNEAGGGAAAEQSLWIGEDYAGAPENLKIETTDTHFILTWEPPTTSRNGGYVDYENCKYNVLFLFGYMETPSTFVENYEGTGIAIHRDTFEIGEQSNVTFFIQSVTSAGAWAKGVVYADAINGADYNLPFSESFPNGYVDTNPWGVNSDVAPFIEAWTILRDDNDNRPEQVYSFDNDGGMAMFYQAKTSLAECRLIAPQVNIGDEGGLLNFYMYHNAGAKEDNWLQIQVKVGSDFVSVGEPILVNSASGWVKHEIKLDAEELGSKSVRPAFLGQGTQAQAFYIDAIRVDSASDNAVGNTEAFQKVTALKGGLQIAADNADYAIYSTDGAIVAKGNVNGTTTVDLRAGAYIVTLNGKACKVIVR